MEEARQGRDAVTLEVVMEAAGPLTSGQLEGLGARSGQAHAKVGGRAARPWLWQFSHPWKWVRRSFCLSLWRLSNCQHLLRHNSHPCPFLCRLWPPLRPFSPPLMFLWCPSHPLPIFLLWYLSCQLPYLITHPGKPPTWLCLPTAGA